MLFSATMALGTCDAQLIVLTVKRLVRSTAELEMGAVAFQTAGWYTSPKINFTVDKTRTVSPLINGS